MTAQDDHKDEDFTQHTSHRCKHYTGGTQQCIYEGVAQLDGWCAAHAPPEYTKTTQVKKEESS